MYKRRWRRLRGRAIQRHPHLTKGLRRLSYGFPFDVYEDRDCGRRSRIIAPGMDYFLEQREGATPVMFADGSMIAFFRQLEASKRAGKSR